MNGEKKEQQQVDDKTKDQTNPSVAILTETLKTLQEQNKALQEKLEAQEKSSDDDKTKELEKNSDLAALLKSLSDEDDPQEKPAKKKADMNALSNEELLDIISGSVEKYVGAMLEQSGKSHSEKIDVLGKKLDQSQQVLARMLTTQNVSSMRAKYPDLDEYADDITKLCEQIPGIPIEKAYKLAKAEKMDSLPAREHVDTEHAAFNIGPSGLPVRRTEKSKEQQEEKPAGPREGSVVQFRSILQAGMERAMANRRT